MSKNLTARLQYKQSIHKQSHKSDVNLIEALVN